MKRFLSVLLAFSMVFSILVFPSGAAEAPSVEVTASRTTLVKSSSPQKVTLSVVLHNPDPVASDIAGISFDLLSGSDKLVLAETALTLTEAFGEEDSATYNSPRFVCIKMSGITPKPITETEVTLMTIEATLAADAPVGSYTISTKGMSVSNTKSIGVFNTDVSVTINVVEEITSEVTLTGSITTPTKGGEDKSALTGDNVTAVISWDPALVEGKFAANKSYTATVTVSPKTGYAFGTGASVKADGLSFTKSGNAFVAKRTFDPTDSRAVTKLEVTKEPTTKSYRDGDAFDPAGMIVKATFDEGDPDPDYKAYSVVYGSGTALKKGDTEVTLRAGEASVKVTGLTVSGKAVTAGMFTFSDPKLTYTGADQAAKVTATCAGDETTRGKVTCSIMQGDAVVTEVTNAGTYAYFADVAGGTEYDGATGIKVAEFTVAAKALADSDFAAIPDQAYTAAQIKPVLSSSLTLTTDYTVAYGDNTNAGTGTVTAAGTGNYIGNIIKSFTITPVTLTAADLEYTGAAITKTYDGGTGCGLTAVAVKAGVLKGSDTLTVTGTAAYDSSDVTATKVIFTPTAITTGNYRLAATEALEIAATIAPFTAVTDNTVTGTADKRATVIMGIGDFPAVTIAGVSGETATGAIAYSYDGATAYDDVKARLAALASGDTAEIGYTYTGDGNYLGASKAGTIYITIVDITFFVGDTPATAANAFVLKDAPAYGDSWKDIVTIGSITAQVGDTGDNGTGAYTLDVAGIPDAGEQSFQILYSGTINGKAYTDVVVCAGSAAVAPRTLTKTDLEYTGPALTKAYDGTTASTLSAVSVKAAALVGSDTLSPGGSAVYNSADVAAADKVIFTPTAITTGNYRLAATEAIELAAVITPKSLDPDGPAVAVTGEYAYTGTAITSLAYTVKDGAAELAESDYTAVISDNVNAGTGKITVTAKAGGNYTWTAPAAGTFTIAKAAKLTLADRNAVHNNTLTGVQTRSVAGLMPVGAGDAAYGAGTVTGDAGILDTWSVAADGLVSYTLNGSGSSGDQAILPVIITTPNYADSTVQVVITLTDKNVPVVNAGSITVTYSGTAIQASAITGTATFDGSSVAGAWSFVGTPDLVSANTGIPVTVLFTPEDPAAYAAVETVITVTINRAKPTGTPGYTPITSAGKTLADAALTAGSITPSGGTISWDLGDAQTVAANTAYAWTYIPADEANYSSLTGTLTPYTVSVSPPDDGGSPTPGGGSPTSPKTDEEKAVESIEKAKPGDTVKIDLGDKTEVKKEVLEAIAGKDITVEITVGEVVWIIDGTDIPLGGLSGLNLGVAVGTSTIPVDIINAVTGDRTTVQLTLTHDGPFGFPLVLQAPLGKTHAGLFANLYFYNKTAGSMEFRTSAQIDGDGKAKLVFTRASEYAIVIDSEAHGEQDWQNPFTDVNADHWFFGDVQYAVENGLFAGTSATTFSPSMPMTRGMLVTVLGRMEGVDPADFAVPSFDDTPADAYYTPYVSWAAQSNIVAGYNEGAFGPNDNVTREQFATILWRYAKHKGMDVSIGEDTNILSYNDALDVSEYAVAALRWACGEGIITGKPGDLLDPKGSATRAEAAAMLHRFLER